MTYEQEPPFAIQIELTEGCNLRCPFCGLSGIREPKDMTWKFMSLDTAQRIASEIARAGWNPRIELAMHGEPTLNPRAPRIIDILRTALPKSPILMLSNGGGLVQDPDARIAGLFAAGLTTLGLDQYQNINLVPRIREKLSIAGGLVTFYDGSQVCFYDYPLQPNGNPHQRVDYKRLVVIAPIDLQTEGTHATLNNHAGAGAAKNAAMVGKRCAKPFRELAFRWNGTVAVCCNDWRGEFAIGDINTASIEEIWRHPRFDAARRKLYHGERDFGPCAGCDAVSYRVGLLPDKKGLHSLPRATEIDKAHIKAALAAGPLTKPVQRPWEVQQ